MSDELFSYRLRRYRESRRLSQDAMGMILGVTGRYIGMMERGDKDVEPTSALAKLFALLEANKLHPQQFIGEHSLQPGSTRDHESTGNRTREEPRRYQAGNNNTGKKSTESSGSSMAAVRQRQALMLSRVNEDTLEMIHASTRQRADLVEECKRHIDAFSAWLNTAGE